MGTLTIQTDGVAQCEKHAKKEEALAKLQEGVKFDEVARDFSEDKARQGRRDCSCYGRPFNRLQEARLAGRRGEASTPSSKRLLTNSNPVQQVTQNMQRLGQALDIISSWSKAGNEAEFSTLSFSVFQVDFCIAFGLDLRVLLRDD